MEIIIKVNILTCYWTQSVKVSFLIEIHILVDRLFAVTASNKNNEIAELKVQIKVL